MAKGIKLTDLISVDILQKIQDGFSKYTGMAALITDVDGIPITRGSNFTDFCMGHMRKSKVACSKCNECDSRGAFMTLEKKQAMVYSCHAGLTDFAVPILIEGQVIGSFIGGQVRTDEVDVEKMRFKAIEYDIDPDSCVRAAKATNMLSKEEIQKAADFLQELGDSISGMAYMHYKALQESRRMEKVAKSQTDFVLNMSVNLEHNLASLFNELATTVEKVTDSKIKSELGGMQSYAEEFKTGIKETVDYMRMSGKKVEIDDNVYNTADIAWQVQTALENEVTERGFFLETEVAPSLPRQMFGDAGRISQVLNKICRMFMENQNGGLLRVSLDSKKISYSTMFVIKIRVESRALDMSKFDTMRENFLKRNFTGFSKDVAAIEATFVLFMLKALAANFKMEHDGKGVSMTLFIPQLVAGNAA